MVVVGERLDANQDEKRAVSRKVAGPLSNRRPDCLQRDQRGEIVDSKLEEGALAELPTSGTKDVFTIPAP